MAETTREWYLRAARELAASSARQHEWCHGVADDARMLALLDALPRPARQPSLLFAVAAHHGAPDAAYPVWAQHVRSAWAGIAAELPRRRVQTNEPGRTAPLAVALGRIRGPIALVELGAAAGLCLLPDRYGYRYRTPDAVITCGASPLTLDVEVDDAALVPPGVPDIRWRRGIDLAPLDVRCPDDVRWLEASLPPDRPDRLARLRAAHAIAAADPPEIVAGDALAALDRVVADAPTDATLVVAALGTAVYLPPAARAGLLATVRAHGARAVTFEARTALPEVAERWAALAADGRVDPAAGFVLALDGEPIASGTPHGDRLTSPSPVPVPVPESTHFGGNEARK